MPARCTKPGGPAMLYSVSISKAAAERRGRGDPAQPPAGHRPGLGEAVDHDHPIVRLGLLQERWRVPAVVDEPRVHLVAHDPDAALARERQHLPLLLGRHHPAGRVVGRVQEDHARARHRRHRTAAPDRGASRRCPGSAGHCAPCRSGSAAAPAGWARTGWWSRPRRPGRPGPASPASARSSPRPRRSRSPARAACRTGRSCTRPASPAARGCRHWAGRRCRRRRARGRRHRR